MTSHTPMRRTHLRDLLVQGNYRVTGRPEPMPADLRRSWRVGLVLLILLACRSGRATRGKLLLTNYAISKPNAQAPLLEVLRGDRSPFFLGLRVDPALGRALDFATGLGFLRPAGANRVELTEHGKRLAQQIEEDTTLYVREKEFLDAVRGLATEKRVNEVLWWR